MLKRLTVENYALIERLDMELSDGLNIITGQTGAGKSILLGALGLVLGNRADTTALKDNSRNCVVEAQFEIVELGLEEYFTQMDIDYDPHTTVRRVISPSGKSRTYINDLPVQLGQLKELSVRLIDIHSQHQSLMVGDEGFRRRIVDSLAANGQLAADYTTTFDDLRRCQADYRELTEQIERSRRDQEWIAFQHEELSALKLHQGEQQELEDEQRCLSNSVEIAAAMGGAIDSLVPDEGGIVAELKTMQHSFERITEFYRPAGQIAERLGGAAIELGDICDQLTGRIDSIGSDPERLDKIDNRLAAIYALERKHGVETTDELIALQQGFAERLTAIELFDQRSAELSARIEELEREAQRRAALLTASRRKAAKELSRGVEQMLGRLGMKGARFECEVSAAETLTQTGGDEINFLFSSAPSLSMQRVEKIASGGEISRVMLCLKAIAARHSMLSTIIFDEIDTGISGAVADITGRIIEELSHSIQVVNITHLPQVAARGTTHFLVYKDQSGRTSIRRLNNEERVMQIAEMLSGSTVSQAAIDHAKELLDS